MILIYLKGSAILLGALFVCLLLRRRSAAIRHMIWTLALASTLLLPFSQLLPPVSLASVPMSAPLFTIVAKADVLNAAVSNRNWVEILWAAGALIFGVRLLINARRATRLVTTSAPSSTEKGYEIRIPARETGPMAWSLLKQVILLPQSAAGWDAERRNAVILHEASHLRRCDSLALLVAELACVVHWCNPLVWLAASRLRREQEHAADDEVLSSGIEPAAYAGHLVGIARANRTPALLAGAVHQSELSARVEAILDSRRNRTMVTRRTVLMSAALLGALVFPLASLQAQRKIHKIGDSGVIPPRLVLKNEPNYTEEAKEAKIEGAVLLSITIEVDGTAQDIRVERSLDQGLDKNAIAAVETWKFEPAQKDGEPVPVAAKVEINFRLL